MIRRQWRLLVAALGYVGTAALIEREQLSVQQATRLLALGASPDAGHVVAIVSLTAGTCRHHFAPDGWNGDLEAQIASAALRRTNDHFLFNHAARMAARILDAHLRSIEYRAKKWCDRPDRRTTVAFEPLA